MRGECRSLTLEGPVSMIKASYSSASQSVNAIKYFRDDSSVTFGTLLENSAVWEFSEANVLIGVRGYSESGLIRQLSFITYTTNNELCTDSEKGNVTEAEGSQDLF